ncbi:MAG TPA: exodeoxyribonuclease VII small subunit [Candidatus Saccharibacteria bacterium]|nr:exodeoxyribonuclease VII small subunit [Candidatus Saccharibacteria bacterium]
MSEKNNSIKEKITKLDELISWFDSDDFDIEKAIEKFKEAEKLSNDIEKDLNNLKNEINIVKQKFD